MNRWMILLLVTLGTLVAHPVHAEETGDDTYHDFECNGIRYRVIDEDARTCMTMPRYSELGKDFEYYPSVNDVLNISEEVSDGIQTYKVVEIGESSFEKVKNIVSVVLPESIKKIDKYAFYRCGSLRSVVLPPSIDTIPNGFVGCCRNLESMDIPEGIKYIGSGAFYKCESLKSLQLPSSLTYLGSSSFSNCYNLIDIVIPDGVEVINSFTFEYCNSLTSVKLPSNLKKIGSAAFNGCYKLEEIELPESLEELADGYEWDEGFGYDPEYYGTFSDTKLKRLVIPDNVKKIGEYALFGCKNLEYLKFPKHLGSIEYSTCRDCCNLKEIVLPDSLREIGVGAFYGCHMLQNIDIPKCTKIIESGAFSNCYNLQRIDIPKGVEIINYCTFYDCLRLQQVGISEGIKVIDEGAFGNCKSLEHIEFPKGIERICARSFRGCSSLQLIDIPEGTERIGSDAFKGCEGLRKIILPGSLESLGDYSFWNIPCPDVEVYYRTSSPKNFFTKEVFDLSICTYGTLYVAKGGLDLARKSFPWACFLNIKEIEMSGVEEVSEESESELPVEVFDMHGRKVADTETDLPPGQYIIRQGDKVRKTIRQ